MKKSEPSIRVKVDPTNPGQFFACCGLLELADRLWGGAEGAFSPGGREFTVTSQGDLREGAESEILGKLASCTITSTVTDEQMARLKSLQNKKKSGRTAEEMAEIQRLSKLRDRERIHLHEPFDLFIDWWNDDESGGSRFKTWAGRQSILDLVRGMQAPCAAGAWSSLSASKWLEEAVGDSSLPLYFDADIGGQSSSIDVGFSMDTLELRSRTRPLLEIAAFVGLQRCRPVPDASGRSFSYVLWTENLPPALAAVACCGYLSQKEARAFVFRLLSRSDYLKSFLPAIPRGG